MLFRQPLLAAIALLALPTGVLSRKGGGGDNDNDSSIGGGSGGYGDSGDYGDSDDTSGSTSPSTGGLTCTDTHRLNLEDFQPSHYDKYNREPRRGHASAYSEYDGVFFKGVGTFTYLIDVVPNKTRDEFSSSDLECPVGERTLRVLGAAWVAAKAPDPKGPENPITVAFKAWESPTRLSDIDYSYSVCDDVDLVRISSTVDFIDGEDVKAMDAVELNITQAVDNSDKIEFDGVYDLKSWADSERSDWRPERYDNKGLSDQFIMLPGGLCSDGSKINSQIASVWPTGTFINGSMTNDTLHLSMSGATIAGFTKVYGDRPEAKVNMTFSITWKGTLDAANSSQIVRTGAASNNASLITFERATGSAAALSMSLYCVVLSLSVGLGIIVV